MATLLTDSNVCRLCSVEFDNGIAIYDSVNFSFSLDSIINRYLPIKVRQRDQDLKRFYTEYGIICIIAPTFDVLEKFKIKHFSLLK